MKLKAHRGHALGLNARTVVENALVTSRQSKFGCCPITGQRGFGQLHKPGRVAHMGDQNAIALAGATTEMTCKGGDVCQIVALRIFGGIETEGDGVVLAVAAKRFPVILGLGSARAIPGRPVAQGFGIRSSAVMGVAFIHDRRAQVRREQVATQQPAFQSGP